MTQAIKWCLTWLQRHESALAEGLIDSFDSSEQLSINGAMVQTLEVICQESSLLKLA